MSADPLLDGVVPPTPTPADLAGTMRSALAAGALDLPPLAGGDSAERLLRLHAIGRLDLSVARLAEAHVDAVQILREAGHVAEPLAWYGVWAAEGPGAGLELVARPGVWELTGTKPFCTGASLVDRALVTARCDGAVVLVDVAVDGSCGVHAAAGAGDDGGAPAWSTHAFAATATATVRFTACPVERGQIVGPAGWYLERPGFWHGACGPAACWAGGAAALVDHATAVLVAAADPLADVAVGELAALAYQNVAVLAQAGREIDEAPDDGLAAHRRALQVRHSVERASTLVLDRFGRALGPRPLAFDPAQVRRAAELGLYLRQCHAERDLAALGATWRTA